MNISRFTTISDMAIFSFIGIYLDNVEHCNITNNDCSNGLNGILLRYSSNNILTNNTANSNTYNGISLFSSSNTLTNNTANSNNIGINLESTRNNILTNNIITSNACGILLTGLTSFFSNNFIYNNYFNNTINAISIYNNIWNIKKTAATNIIGGTYLGGNYWSDYEGKDTDGDGLGDTLLPYDSSGKIRNEGDYHPLVQSGSLNETVSIGSAAMDINDTIVVPNTIENATNIRASGIGSYS